MKKLIKRIKQFLTIDIWIADLEKVSKKKNFLIKFLQALMLALKGFKEDKLNVRASALTYFTLLSIVPVLALGFGIAKGFGLEAVLESEIAKSLSGQKEALEYILKFTRSMLDTAKGGVVAGIGLIVLLWSVIKLLTNIEDTFNTVWEVPKSRSVLRKFTDYLSIVLIAPIMMILASSITIFISTQLSSISADTMFDFATPLLLNFAKIIPYIIFWLLFTLIYLVMPNTTVKFRSALIAGIIAGTTFQIFQGIYIYFQAGATRINAIYGSFAALPLFLMWLQISWFVVLLGAEISFAVQSVKMKGKLNTGDDFSIFYQKKVALLIVKNIVANFNVGKKAHSCESLASLLRIPVYTVKKIIEKLLQANLISKIAGEKDLFYYQPAENINNINLMKVLNGLENVGVDNSKFVNKSEIQQIDIKLKEINDSNKISDKNILLKDL